MNSKLQCASVKTYSAFQAIMLIVLIERATNKSTNSLAFENQKPRKPNNKIRVERANVSMESFRCERTCKARDVISPFSDFEKVLNLIESLFVM